MAIMSFEELCEEMATRRIPWWQRLWWKVYRAWDWTRMLPRRVKWFIQRGLRGWSDFDLYSLDHYLSEWLPCALRALKERKHGTPMQMFDGLVPEDQWHDIPESASEEAARRWDTVLDAMIAGFEAWQRIKDGLYEPELGPYEVRRPPDLSRDDWRARKDNRFAQMQALVERDMKTFEHGMSLFGKHFGNLWD